jgi:hypothetical protein
MSSNRADSSRNPIWQRDANIPGRRRPTPPRSDCSPPTRQRRPWPAASTSPPAHRRGVVGAAGIPGAVIVSPRSPASRRTAIGRRAPAFGGPPIARWSPVLALLVSRATPSAGVRQGLSFDARNDAASILWTASVSVICVVCSFKSALLRFCPQSYGQHIGQNGPPFRCCHLILEVSFQLDTYHRSPSLLFTQASRSAHPGAPRYPAEQSTPRGCSAALTLGVSK